MYYLRSLTEKSYRIYPQRNHSQNRYVLLKKLNDKNWKFNEFLKRNEDRLQSDSLKYGRLQITLNSEKLNFFTYGLGDSGKFLTDYCNTMKNLMPESENHIYAGTEIIEETEL